MKQLERRNSRDNCSPLPGRQEKKNTPLTGVIKSGELEPVLTKAVGQPPKHCGNNGGQKPNGCLTVSYGQPNGSDFCKSLQSREVYGLTGKSPPGSHLSIHQSITPALHHSSPGWSNQIQPGPTTPPPPTKPSPKGRSEAAENIVFIFSPPYTD